jgi:hypothetical protein
MIGMKPFFRFDEETGKWYARTFRDAVNTFVVGAECPFIAFMAWMEQSLKVGEQ